jgi:hypothetical protein
MHSTCVATYHALITLIIERPTLLDDYENLFKLCEIIELGISGEKAQVLLIVFFFKRKNSIYEFCIQSPDGLVLKKYKEHHPASQRVAEAAEYLMFVLFEHKVRLPIKTA